MIEIIQARLSDIPKIQQISDVVWPATFCHILTKEQIEYMMDMMYSTESLTSQMKNRHNYILVKEENEYLGYLSYEININNKGTKIHKIYVLPNTQGKGIGAQLIEHVKQQAMLAQNEILRLNVNRYNNALNFYKHIGFEVVGTEDIDIGNGFLMEDYILEMKL